MNRRQFLATAAATPLALALPAISRPGLTLADWRYAVAVDPIIEARIEAARHAVAMAQQDMILFGRGVVYVPDVGLPRCIAWFHGEPEPAGSLVFKHECAPSHYGTSLADLLNSTSLPLKPAEPA